MSDRGAERYRERGDPLLSVWPGAVRKAHPLFDHRLYRPPPRDVRWRCLPAA